MKKGQKVKTTKKGTEIWSDGRMRYGVVTGLSKKFPTMFYVQIDGQKTKSLYHPDFWEPI